MKTAFGLTTQMLWLCSLSLLHNTITHFAYDLTLTNIYSVWQLVNILSNLPVDSINISLITSVSVPSL